MMERAGETLVLERVNTPPAQTWNYLRTNDITLEVPVRSRAGDVYFALPRLFSNVSAGMGADVTSWVTSQAQDARYVEVKAQEHRLEPIIVDLDAQGIADVGVMVRAEAEATIVIVAHGDAGAGQTSAALLRIICERASTVHLLEFVCADDGHQHLESVGIDQAADAHVDVRQFFLGAGTSACGLACAMRGAGGHFNLTCRYLGRGKDVLDLNHVVRQMGPNTRANLSESGVLDGAAKKSLRATIDLVHGGKGAEGAELESVLVLSDDVTNKTMPVILCDEDDVVGNHGATIGSIGGEQRAYLADRGLTNDECEALYVRALFDEALIAAPTAAVRDAVLTRAEAVLGSEVARDLIEGLELELTSDNRA